MPVVKLTSFRLGESRVTFMATRVYASFPTPSAEAAFLGIDDYDQVERRLEIFEAQLDGAEADAWDAWDAMRADQEVAELSDFRLSGFGRANGFAIPENEDPYCGGIPLDHPAVMKVLDTAGNGRGVRNYGFCIAQDIIGRLRACGCTEIYWC
jgi:hypothetical protein